MRASRRLSSTPRVRRSGRRRLPIEAAADWFAPFAAGGASAAPCTRKSQEPQKSIRAPPRAGTISVDAAPTRRARLMTQQPRGVPIHHLRKLASMQRGGELTDGELLRRFVTAREET